MLLPVSIEPVMLRMASPCAELVRGVPRIPDVRTKGQDGKKRHGDAAIAFVLAYYASRELNTGPIRVASRRIRRKSALTKGY